MKPNFIVDHWRAVVQRWSFRFANLAVVLPELMQTIANNSDLIPWMDSEIKGLVRLVLIIAALLAMPVKQKTE